ncbi:unhealthy ribosome biogenesis protein 2 homolog [Clupea harengus]|uniref:Unhealthy ribosome biogenesis protein 2 homolog n=1 Tax=Clupea harengus TaxID=7950 RepID=A0A6P8G585_CLUHA|nr:unhealthy ribosome biogenesis protein 2 homolog [Clupea harengus]
MAAIYSGIHLKLKSPQTPWTDKLKLARFAWISPQCVLPNKEQVLFDWTSHALTLFYSKKIDLAQKVVEGLWVYFDDIIHSKKLQNVLSQGKTISLRIAVAQVINDRILEYSSGQCSVSLATVLSCLRGILSSPVLSVTYTAKYELLGELLARLSHLACSRLSLQHSGEPLSAGEFEMLLLTLSTYLTVQRQQANANRVFTQVTSNLLQPLLVLRYLLSSRTWSEEDGEVRLRQHVSKEIRSKVDAALQVALFFPDNLQAYKDELLLSSGEEPAAGRKGRAGKGLPSPLSTILAKLCAPGSCDPAVLYAVVSTSLPLLFKFALDAFCKGGDNKLVCFHLMTKFVSALDFTEDLTLKDTFNAGNWNLVLLALENLLNSCLNGDIYNVAADRIQHEEVQLKFYRKLTQVLFNNAQTATPAWYRCLKTLLALNHMIVEPDLDELVSSVWVDSDCTEPRVRKARDALISATLTTYTKLRQLPRLFEELLTVVCRPAMDELRQPLVSETMEETLALCLRDTPGSQSLELCELILERIRNDVLPDIREQDGDAALKMFSLCVLLHAVLFSLKTLDNGTPLPLVRQTQRFMGEMLATLKSLLEWLRDVPLSGQKVRESGLLLTYTWVEMDALFQMHCSKYFLYGDMSSSEVKDESLWLLSEVLVKDWDQAALEGYSSVGQLFQKFLALQMMKKIILRSDFASDSSHLDVLQNATQFIVGRGESLPTQFDHLWDLQISSVDADSYPAAHWLLVTTNLHLIAPFLTDEDTAHLATLLLQSVLQRDAEAKGDKQGLSVAIISKQLLDSVVLIELPSLYSAVARSVMQSLTQTIDTQCVGSVCPSLLKPVEEFSREGCDMEEMTNESAGDGGVDPAVVKRLKSVAQEILTTVVSGSPMDLSVAQVDNLLNLFKVSSALNVDGMSLIDYSELFLISFMMATCTQPCGDVEVSVKMALLTDAYNLLTSLLSARNAQFILKFARGSKLLEGAVASLLSRANKGLFENVGAPDWSSFLQAVHCFLQRLLDLIIQRKSSMRLNLEQFASFLLAQSEAAMTATAASGDSARPDPASLLSLQLLLASLSTTGDVMTSSLGKGKQLDQTLVQLLGKILTSTGPVVQASLISGAAGQAFSVDVVAGMVRSELACLSHQAAEGGPEAEGPPTLIHMGLYRSCSLQVLKELCLAPRPIDFILSSLHFLTAYYSAAERANEPGIEEVFVDILHNVHKLLSVSWLSQAELKELQNPVRSLIGQLVATSSLERFNPVLLLLREGLDVSKIPKGNHREVFSAVTVTRLLANCELPESCSKAFWLIAPQIISAMVFVVRESGKETSLISTLTIPALEALSVLLRQGEGLLYNPHHVTLALGATQFVPLEHLSVQDYHAAFEAIHEVLFAIIQCHTQVMLTAAPAFLNCFYRLVASIMFEGKQKGELERASEDGRELLKCARLVERMYSHVATTAEGFTVLSSFIVAQYVSELQKVTLRPEIKTHLTEGIYNILDLCAERDIKFLNTTLPHGLREVLNELYGSYQHYHKAQRQGEEKYTA